MNGSANLPGWRRAAELTGRRSECQMLDQLIAAVRAGESRGLVVHGEPGVGKTALLEYMAVQAAGCQVVRVAGVESEMELAFAGLHQLCAPQLGRLDALPGPQRNALLTAFGIREGAAPDRFLVGLAVLGLLSEVAVQRPLICLIDDQQWLDQASAQVLSFVARRLGTESIGLVFATRTVGRGLAGVPGLALEGLSETDARALLDTVLPGPIDERVRDQIVFETRGNPLALLELPRGLAPAELAGGFGFPSSAPLSGSIEAKFVRQIERFPEPTRRLLQIAAADPSGDPALIWRAAGSLGIGFVAAEPAADARLVAFDTRVRFRHPLARSAAYWSASVKDRQEAHRILAAATDQRLDPDRRAWHRAQAASGPDEDVAAELERSAGRAQARGGLSAAAAFLERSAMLTLDPERQGARALAAAQAKYQAGLPNAALSLLSKVDESGADEMRQARADLLRAQIAFTVNRGRDTPSLLLKAAARLEQLDPALARDTYLDALRAAWYAAHLARGTNLRDVARAARTAPAPPVRRPPDLLLDGLAVRYTEGYATGAPILHRALRAFCRPELPAEEGLRWLWFACSTAVDLFDDDTSDILTRRFVQLARDTGALTTLPLALTTRIVVQIYAGKLNAAAMLLEELKTLAEGTGIPTPPYTAQLLAAWQGKEAVVNELFKATTADAERRGEGLGLITGGWMRALLYNGLGRYEEALVGIQQATAWPQDMGILTWATLAELITAAAHLEQPELATDALERLGEMTRASATDWGLGTEAYCRALLNRDRAERYYEEAIDHLSRTRIRGQLGRAHLYYGEWLRQLGRRDEARNQLRTAHELFTSLGISGFAERAAFELRASGAATRKRAAPARDDELTAQEAQIAGMARDGLSNPEIATRLFISARTVQYHLRKAFTKLGITSRSQLDRVLPNGPEGDRPV
ncbi:ATP-binding protein [Streptomyces nigra]|uniref:ATP-binding protein n=1 Tax=Streptomyces nigra TaxID=1827580 RepID=UPI0037F9A5E2